MKIRSEIFEIRGAALEGLNPLPKFRPRKPSASATAEGFPEELKRDMGFYSNKVMPYLMQDRYSRKRDVLKLKSYVLENEYLIARFFPEYGGRLHSLFDKKSSRELLFANPVIQPGNLALRNAWLSGGIEWNIGSVGHTYTTCDNVFSAILSDGHGNDFLRIYEFERGKSVFWQVDFHLPEGSPRLFSHVRLVNPFDKDTTVYWWTNIAVPTGKERTRVLASNKNVISFVGNSSCYEELPEIAAMPGIDATYPENATRAFDYFIQKDKEGESTWEAAAYGDGLVFYERSTAPLYYKKLFCWGAHRGGDRWQESLSDGVGTGYYAEIQAGIAPSQLHDKIFPKKSRLEWTQCYGGISLDPERLHDKNYHSACAYLGENIDALISEDEINAINERFSRLADIPVSKNQLKTLGSGFGALECLRMMEDGDGVPPQSMCFPEDSIGEAESVWLTLLREGKFPSSEPTAAPLSYMISEKWIPRIALALAKDGEKNWLAALHYGVAVYEYYDMTVLASRSYDAARCALQTAAARLAWQSSVKAEPNAFAYRNLAVLEKTEGNQAEAERYYDLAISLPGAFRDYALPSEYLAFLCDFGKYEKAWKLYVSLPENCKVVDRVKITAAHAAVKLGNLDFVEAFFAEDHYDIREGENTMTDIWFEFSARKLARERGITELTDDTLAALIDEAWEICPPSSKIDFRMSTSKKNKYRI